MKQGAKPKHLAKARAFFDGLPESDYCPAKWSKGKKQRVLVDKRGARERLLRMKLLPNFTGTVWERARMRQLRKLGY